MLTRQQAQALAADLARSARSTDAAAHAKGAELLSGLDAKSLLALDDAARGPIYLPASVSGNGWDLGSYLGPATPDAARTSAAFIASIAALHVDGRVRQAACARLRMAPSTYASAVLAVRLLDHVPQVRHQAWDSLQHHLTPPSADGAAAALDVVLTASKRRHATAAIDLITDHLLASPGAGVLFGLTTAAQPLVRRWALQGAHQAQVLSTEQQFHVLLTDPDQIVRVVVAEQLAAAGDPSTLSRLLRAKSATTRLIAVRRLEPHDLDGAELDTLLLDRSARVGEHARWLARRRGVDVAERYRRLLTARSDDDGARRLAAALAGVSETGDAGDLAAVHRYLHHSSARVRQAALGGVVRLADHAEAVAELREALEDPSARVCTAAARSLVRLKAPAEAARRAWASAQPWSRRAAWIVSHSAGSWDRVEGDLRASLAPDVHLAGSGQDSLRGWLREGAATTWAPVSADRAERLQALLQRSPLSETERDLVAFHAGLTRASTPVASPSRDAVPVRESKGQPWKGWLKRLRRQG